MGDTKCEFEFIMDIAVFMIKVAKKVIKMNRDNQKADIHPLKFGAFVTLGLLAASSVSAFTSAVAHGEYDPAAYHGVMSGVWLGISHGFMKDRSEKAIGLKGHLAGYFAGAALCLALPEPYGDMPDYVSNSEPKIEIVEPENVQSTDGYIPYP